ncbi:AAA family ATPase [Halochromatium glycolicum]|uniref:AAA+ ATPase domain-containing protein n=1 Tax=Halochromatium glycolicum TaxID=85075 RepID=A0AAJ0XC95_9GAMM|nr:AAA family ATPase [Halochromatium glycolicum]MBK1706642.1 hypothetical protein [Halochromatium glycolicum]
MFEAFYGLREDPFRLSADHRFCFPHRNYARARAYVDYALHRAEGFVMVTGSPGTGKTTLINELLSNLPKQTTRAATLLSTRLEAEDLLRMTAYSLGLKSREQPKAMLLQQLMERVKDDYLRGIRTLLIIDEAQDLNAPALEELRLLTNLHEGNRPLLQIVLVGQEPLRQLVRRPEMEQLHQRLIAAWHLQPLGPEEAIAYVRHRLEIAGWQGDPVFEPGVMETVFAFSQGVPRRINLICSRLLLHGCIGELHSLSREDAVDLVAELGEEELAPAADGRSAGSDAEVDWAAIDQGLIWTPPEPEPLAHPSPDPSATVANQAEEDLQEEGLQEEGIQSGEKDAATDEPAPEATATGKLALDPTAGPETGGPEQSLSASNASCNSGSSSGAGTGFGAGSGSGSTPPASSASAESAAPDGQVSPVARSDSSADREQAGVGSATGAAQAQQKPIEGASAQRTDAKLGPPPGLAVEDVDQRTADLDLGSPPPGLAVEDAGDLPPTPSPERSPPALMPVGPRARRVRVMRRRGPIVLGIVVFVVLILLPRDLLEWRASDLLRLLRSPDVSMEGSSPPS